MNASILSTCGIQVTNAPIRVATRGAVRCRIVGRVSAIPIMGVLFRISIHSIKGNIV